MDKLMTVLLFLRELLEELVDMVTKANYRMIDGAPIKVKEHGMVEGTDQDNTAVWASILRDVESNQTIDLQGGSYRIFEGITGIPSSGADPNTDRAISEELIPALRNKRGVTIKNGTIYVADQATTSTKSYFPNTLTIADCEDIILENVNLESKGESYGDADASSPLSRPDRHLFLQYNSGVALLISKCRNVVINGGNFRLCGSVGVIYTSSSSRITLNQVFANAASLGYAAFAHDSWVGSTANGFAVYNDHEVTLNSCNSYAETVLRREDGAQVGSSIYATKGCVVIEDEDVKCFVNGGVFRDAYPNGSARDNGFAFNANIATMHVQGAYVENCHAIGNTGQSANGDGILFVSNVVGRDIRHAMHICMGTSFGAQHFQYVNCDVEINGTGSWPSDSNRARVASCVVSNLKAGSPVYGQLSNCRVIGARAISINDAVVFGYLKADNCYFETTDWGILSEGWGGSTQGFNGIELHNCQLVDTSSRTDAYIIYTNLDAPSSFTHIYLNFSTSTLRTVIERPAYDITVEGTNLLRQIWGFNKMYGAYGSGYVADKQQTVVYKEERGTVGSGHRIVVFEYPDRCAFRPQRIPDGSANTGALKLFSSIGANSAAVINGDGNLEQEHAIGDTGLTLWAPGTVIICDALPITDDDNL